MRRVLLLCNSVKDLALYVVVENVSNEPGWRMLATILKTCSNDYDECTSTLRAFGYEVEVGTYPAVLL